MKARFGRNIKCQKCNGENLVIHWNDKFAYYYVCRDCKIKVKERNQGE